VKNHLPIRIFSGHLSDVEAIEFHPNSHYLATGSSDKQIRLWSVLDGECVRIMFTVAGTVTTLKFTKGGNQLLAANDKGQIVVLDVEKARVLDVIDTLSAKPIWDIDISQDDMILACAHHEGKVSLYSIDRVINQR